MTNTGDVFPMGRIIDFEGYSAVFETTNPVEDYRARELGGERMLAREWVSRVSEQSLIWDVGANIGVYSILAARAGATVHSFEPDPGFAERLRRNVSLNGLESAVTVHEIALGDNDGPVVLYTDGISGMSPAIGQGPEENRGFVDVEMKRGDALNLSPPELLKIDVEGAEGAVIRGMRRVLERVDVVFLELHPPMMRRLGDNEEMVVADLEKCGFSLEYEQEREEQVHQIWEK